MAGAQTAVVEVCGVFRLKFTLRHRAYQVFGILQVLTPLEAKQVRRPTTLKQRALETKAFKVNLTQASTQDCRPVPATRLIHTVHAFVWRILAKSGSQVDEGGQLRVVGFVRLCFSTVWLALRTLGAILLPTGG